MAVGAVVQRSGGLEIAPFSSTFPQVVGPGVDVVSAQANSATGLVALSGTSMATHAAGIAALWWQKLGAAATAGIATNRLVGSASLSGFTTT